MNPWNNEDLADAINEAVMMTDEARKENHEKLYRYVNKHTAAYWGLSFVKELQRIADSNSYRQVPKLVVPSILSSFRSATKQKLLLLDYDGTLTTLQNLPEFANPSARIIELVERLAKMPDVYVYIFSGRPRSFLDKWFGGLGVGLCAEHGCFVSQCLK